MHHPILTDVNSIDCSTSDFFPFIKENSVLLICGSTKSALYRYAKAHRYSLAGLFSSLGFTFVNIPDLISEMPDEALEYAFPGAGKLNEDEICATVQRLAGVSGKEGFLRYEEGRLRFDPITGDGGVIELMIYSYLAGFRSIEHIKCSTAMLKEQKPESGDRHRSASSDYCEAYSCEDWSAVRHMREVRPAAEEPLDPKALAILEEIQTLQRKYGISIEELDLILGYTVKLSRLRITRTGRIFLTDFSDREIKMDRLSKAVYFLFLRHPEGIRFKELCDFREELLSIYMKITGRGDMAEIRKSVEDLVDPLNNGINVKVSRIKSAFCSAISDRVARFYYVAGQSGELKKIILDRDCVIWEQ